MVLGIARLSKSRERLGFRQLRNHRQIGLQTHPAHIQRRVQDRRDQVFDRQLAIQWFAAVAG